MHIAILGRQPALGMAELEKLYGSESVRWFSDTSALVDTDELSIARLGGTVKAGRVVAELPRGDWRQASMRLVRAYARAWVEFDGKITLGISAYGFSVSPREVQKTGIVLKQKLKGSKASLRLLPNATPALSTAAAHHNKLGLASNKVELLVIRARSGKIIIAESTGAQNITAYARRDQERPKRDAFVGMLPPKLAQMMINLASPKVEVGTAPRAVTRAGVTAESRPAAATSKHLQPELQATPGHDLKLGAKPFASGGGRDGEQNNARLLDPFCGTGVLLQEAALLGYSVYGTDLSDKMIDFTQQNLQWLADSHRLNVDATLHQGDAMTTKWSGPISAVACETYLGQPFSAPPSPAKLAEVRKNCDHIISTFLKNIASQLAPGTPLCVAVPAWRAQDGSFTHLPLAGKLEQLGFAQHEFKNVTKKDLLYYREDQVVARELLVLTRR